MLAAACIPAMLPGQQQGAYSQVVEALLYQNETSVIPEEVFDMLEENSFKLLDLNNASQEQLEASGLFTPFQVHQLIRYRERFGAIYSIYELAALPGFDASKLPVLESILKLTPSPETPEKKPAKHMVMIDVGKTYPESVAYQMAPSGKDEKLYAGSPLYTTLRIRSQLGNHLSLGLTYEKDAGETLRYQGMPQFLSGYLLYQGEQIIKQLVAGTFQLNHGLGLVNGTGFFHVPAAIRVNQHTLSLLRPYASKTEQRFYRGLACQLGHKRFQILLWASHTHQDLSPGPISVDPGVINWWEHQRATGLHRTSDELEGRALAARINGGVQLLYQHREFALGMMTGIERLAVSKRGSAILGNSYNPVKFQTASLHGNWQHGQWQVFGELAAGASSSLACQLGTVVQFNDFLQGTLLVHHYGTAYQGSLPSSYASGSHVENEQGVAFHLHMEPGRLLLADVTGEIFKYPSPRYQTLVPSHAYSLALSLQNPPINQFQWRIRFVGKAWQSTPDAGTAGVRPLKESRVTRFDGRLVHHTGGSIRWQSRLVISILSPQQKPVPAYAALQQIDFLASPNMHCSVQFVLFHIKDWENRIYLHEPGFYYSFSFPFYYGSGQKTTFLLSLKALKGITLSAKMSGISYYDRETMGSGKDLVQGNKKWETALQLRLKF
jgi:hypothetical protein